MQPAPLWLPTLNTALIVISGILALTGYHFIRRRELRHHKWSMFAATGFAALFLCLYITRALLFETKLFAGDGVAKIVYLGLLGSHTLVAAAVGPLVLVTLYLALRGDYKRHRRLARITLPLWLYAVATGWIVYLMLYRLF